MAMVFQCSSLLCHPKHHIYSKSFSFLGFRAMLSSDPVRRALAGGNVTSGHSDQSEKCWLFPRESCMRQQLTVVQLLKCGKIGINTFQEHPQIVLQGRVNQEAWFTKTTKFPAMTLLFINVVLGLAMPLEALAETCEADSSLFNMPLLLFVALVGAAVGGLLARQRKGELQRLNDQLRQINAALRRQAKIESYAPALSYAPVGSRAMKVEVIVDPKKEILISHLKTGKRYLRNLDLEKALEEFKIALELAQELKDPIEEKKAARGVGASLQRQKKYNEAIKYHNLVLAISKRVGETSGDTEAYGAIADCYTELGDLENAGKHYDKYIARLEAD